MLFSTPVGPATGADAAGTAAELTVCAEVEETSAAEAAKTPRLLILRAVIIRLLLLFGFDNKRFCIATNWLPRNKHEPAIRTSDFSKPVRKGYKLGQTW
jgi:hypothetical protein